MVLAARRVLLRGETLTCQAMIHEYQQASAVSRYSFLLLHRACLDLLDAGVLRPAMDHGGTGPLLYSGASSTHQLPAPELQALPLHLTVDIHRELKPALEQATTPQDASSSNRIRCSTALREWGKRAIS